MPKTVLDYPVPDARDDNGGSLSWPDSEVRSAWRRAVLELREQATRLGRDRMAEACDRELSALWVEEHRQAPRPVLPTPKRLALTISADGTMQAHCHNRVEYSVEEIEILVLSLPVETHLRVYFAAPRT
jgi:hypothetical protein